MRGAIAAGSQPRSYDEQVADFMTPPQPDREAIGKTLLTLLKSFDYRNAEPLPTVYSEDAD